MDQHPNDQVDIALRTERSRGRPVASWREHHGWSAAASLRRLFSRPLGTFLTIAVMGLALALPLAFYLLLANVQNLGDALGQNQAVSAFLKPGQAGAAVEALATSLRERTDVAAVGVKTPQQGMDELAKMQGFGTALHTLDENPLPYVLEVMPKPDIGADGVERLVTDMRAMRGVDQVQDAVLEPLPRGIRPDVDLEDWRQAIEHRATEVRIAPHVSAHELRDRPAARRKRTARRP